MNDLWNSWLEAFRFACEAQNAISTRIMLLAAGAPDAVVEETAHIVCERFLTFAKAGIAAEQALENGFGTLANARPVELPRSRGDRDDGRALLRAVH